MGGGIGGDSTSRLSSERVVVESIGIRGHLLPTPPLLSRYLTRRKHTIVQIWVVLGFQAPFGVECETHVPGIQDTDDDLCCFHTIPLGTPELAACSLNAQLDARFLTRDFSDIGYHDSRTIPKAVPAPIRVQSLIVVPTDYCNLLSGRSGGIPSRSLRTLPGLS